MKSLTLDKRVIFVIACDDGRKIVEARFKLAEYCGGFGTFDNACYFSLPLNKSVQGYRILKAMFTIVRLFEGH